MKYLLASTLLIALLASCGGEEKTEEKAPADTTAKVAARKMGELKIAFYSQDSMAVHFDYYRESDSILKAQQRSYETEAARQEKAYMDWANGIATKEQQGLLTENDIIRVQQEAQTRQAKIQEYQQAKAAELEKKFIDEMGAISKKIDKFSKDYCEANNLDMLIKRGVGGQFAYIHGSMDVTEEFVAYLNQAQEELISGN